MSAVSIAPKTAIALMSGRNEGTTGNATVTKGMAHARAAARARMAIVAVRRCAFDGAAYASVST